VAAVVVVDSAVARDVPELKVRSAQELKVVKTVAEVDAPELRELREKKLLQRERREFKETAVIITSKVRGTIEGPSTERMALAEAVVVLLREVPERATGVPSKTKLRLELLRRPRKVRKPPLLRRPRLMRQLLRHPLRELLKSSKKMRTRESLLFRSILLRRRSLSPRRRQEAMRKTREGQLSRLLPPRLTRLSPFLTF